MINALVESSLLSEKFSRSATPANRNVSIPSMRKQEVAKHLDDVLNSIISCSSFVAESEVSLDLVSNEILQEDVDEDGDSDDSALSTNFMGTGNDEYEVFLQTFSLDYMKKVIEYYDEKEPIA
ncbi:unnamed protein product [Rotaria sp. Silwood2]|nr:unnamed protein product [Rotaria sp. Silwood2]CAF3499320.1 unnamed protein product [Rotaria sp. Silwood2]CAF4383149.1 unnamed protein product [Rotaria sp. Silwood2]CAF4472832.1 unnamed protein product [Rotaria sp. Silwood2]